LVQGRRVPRRVIRVPVAPLRAARSAGGTPVSGGRLWRTRERAAASRRHFLAAGPIIPLPRHPGQRPGV